MSNPVPGSRPSFEDNISTLLEELLLASKWQRPSLLLAVHKSKFGQDKAQAILEARLSTMGHPVVHITVDRDHSDIPHLIVNTPNAERAMFFVSNIDWGAGEDHRDAYRALNIYRELFVDHRIKLVLWLTTNEAASLARHAPDFWAFRHRVVEFTGQRIPRKISLPSGALLWDIQNSVDPFDTLEARIAVREELLAQLPDNMEARSSRIDLLYNLGYLEWLLGNTNQALEQLKTALHLAEQSRAASLHSSPLNGLAILAYEAGDTRHAAGLLAQAIEANPDIPYLLANLGVTASSLGRNQEAINLAAKAVKMNARDPRLWSSRGYLFAATGKFDEAMACFGRAVELAPRATSYLAALAICYSLVERQDEASRCLSAAREAAGGSAGPLLDIYEAAFPEDPSNAVRLVRAAIQSGQLSVLELRRDPNLVLLLDSAQIEAITA